MMDNKTRLLALLAAIAGAAALRLVPHPWNVSPIDAMALFSGAFLPRRLLALIAPLAALLLSDVLIGFYQGMAYVYVSVAAIVLVGFLLSSRRSVLRVGAAAVASSVLFFVVSNFGVWAGSGMYPHSLAGLAECYAAAIPFFRNTLAGDLAYAALLFGGFTLLERSVSQLRAAPQPA